MTKHHLSRLRDKYLPLVIGFLLASVIADAQGYLPPMNNNYSYRRLRVDSTFTPPYGPTASLRGDPQDIYAPRLFYRTTDSTLVVWTGSQWLQVGKISTLQQSVDAQGSLTATDSYGAALDSDGGLFFIKHPYKAGVLQVTPDLTGIESRIEADYITGVTLSGIYPGNNRFSEIQVHPDTIFFKPGLGNIKIDTLTRLSSASWILSRDSTSGMISYVPTTSIVGATPSWQQSVNASPGGLISASTPNLTQIDDNGGRLFIMHGKQISLHTRAASTASEDSVLEITMNTTSGIVLKAQRNVLTDHIIGNIVVKPDSVFSTKILIGQNGLKTYQTPIPSVSSSTGDNAPKVLQVIGGAGGATSNSGGFAMAGNGAAVTISPGPGGSTTGTPTTGIGGNGGIIELIGSDGGNGYTIGGNGTVVLIAAGSAGRGTSTNTSGAPGHVAIKPGNAAVSTDANGGNVYIQGGIASGTGHDGTIYLGLSESLTQRGNVSVGTPDTDHRKLFQSYLNRNMTDTGWGIHSATTGSTYNTTSGVKYNYAGSFLSNATRSGGGNNLYNVALYAKASGGDLNYSGQFDGTLMILGGQTNLTSNLNKTHLYLKRSSSSVGAGFYFDGVSASDMYMGGAPSSDDIIISQANQSTNELVRFKQNGQVGIGTNSPASTSILDISSTTRGFLPPRMTTTQRDAISSPAEGLTIYNLTDHKTQTWDGTTWQSHW